MARRVPLGIVIGALIGCWLAVAHAAPLVDQRGIRCTSTESHVVGARGNRIRLVVQNVDASATIWIGGETRALDVGNGWVLHVAGTAGRQAGIDLGAYKGALSCIATSTNSGVLGVIEVLE